MTFASVVVRKSLPCLAIILGFGADLRASDDLIGSDNPPVIDSKPTTFDVNLFDHWLFEGSANRARSQMKVEFELNVLKLQYRYGLSDSEQQKLLLAGYGDIHVYFRKVEETRRRFAAVDGDAAALRSVQQDVLKLRAEAYNGLFGQSSLYRKVAYHLLGADLALRMRQQQAKRLRHAAEEAVRTLAQNVTLMPGQQEQLVTLLLQDGPKYDFANSELDDIVMMYRLARFPEESLTPVFDRGQWANVTYILSIFSEYRTVLEDCRMVDRQTGELRPAPEIATRSAAVFQQQRRLAGAAP